MNQSVSPADRLCYLSLLVTLPIKKHIVRARLPVLYFVLFFTCTSNLLASVTNGSPGNTTLIEGPGHAVSAETFVASLQQTTITGTVTSAVDQTPLPGVSVVLKGTQEGTVTDAQGKYSIGIPTSSAVLVFSFIGYQTAELEANSRSVIDVALAADVTQLEEVVVTSFGIEQEKRSLGFSAQSVSGENLMQMRQPNVVSALQGQVAGVQITNSGGAPGMSSRIIVRGITSLDPTASNQPLFVVDGIPIDNSTFEVGSGATPNTPRGLSNRALDINPSDIESVNVLKGAAATALYGVRAANGAIVITTKKGKAGKVQITASSTLGLEQINKYPSFQNKYGQGSNKLYAPDDIFPAWGAPIDVANLIDPEYRYYNNVKNAMQTGKSWDNHLSISGGNDFATFYASLSNTDHEGVIPFSTWARTVAKISGTLKFSEKFSTSVSVNYTNSGGNRVPHDRFMEDLMYYPATRDVRNFEDENGLQNYVGLSNNPLYSAKYWTFEDNVDRILGNIHLNYRPASWISLNYRLGTDFYSDFREEIAPGPRSVADAFPVNSDGGYIEHTRITSRILNSNFYVELNKNIFDRFNATLRLGHELFEEERNSLVNTGKEFDIPEFFQFSNTRQLSTLQYLRERRLIGAYGDLLLNYGDFLYLNITGRNDWTSTLPAGNNSFFYPSFNVSFVFNEVLNLPDLISFGKLRASYGEVGKDTEPYLTSTVYEKELGFPIDGVLAYGRANTRGNENLKPERTTTIDLGTELKLFENRLGIEFTWYKSNSKDQIFQVPISETTGYALVVENVGEIENKGIELIVSGSPLRTSSFQWDIVANFTRNRNRVVEIAEGLDEFPLEEQFGYSGSTVTMKLKEGDAYGNLYGSSFQRYYDEVPTNLKYVEHDRPLLIGANGFPVRNTSQLVLGNAQPQWLGGIRNTFTYKGFSLSFLIDARWGVDQYDQFHNFLSAFGKLDYSENRNDVVVFDGVLADGTPNTKEVFLGQAVGPDGVDYGQGFYRVYFRTTSENFVKDASFVKLRNVSLAYAFPKTWLEKTPFQSASVSATVNNIILWTPWINFDPESFSSGAGGNATGFSGLTYPSTMSTLFSLHLTL
jgi:TonB-linked SusC/RagA family outer membrane protein